MFTIVSLCWQSLSTCDSKRRPHTGMMHLNRRKLVWQFQLEVGRRCQMKVILSYDCKVSSNSSAVHVKKLVWIKGIWPSALWWSLDLDHTLIYSCSLAYLHRVQQLYHILILLCVCQRSHFWQVLSAPPLLAQQCGSWIALLNGITVTQISEWTGHGHCQSAVSLI